MSILKHNQKLFSSIHGALAKLIIYHEPKKISIKKKKLNTLHSLTMMW